MCTYTSPCVLLQKIFSFILLLWFFFVWVFFFFFALLFNVISVIFAILIVFVHVVVESSQAQAIFSFWHLFFLFAGNDFVHSVYRYFFCSIKCSKNRIFCFYFVLLTFTMVLRDWLFFLQLDGWWCCSVCNRLLEILFILICAWVYMCVCVRRSTYDNQ